MSEERHAARLATKHQGRVQLPGRPDIACLVRDVSATGARLQFGARIFLPRSFSLHFDGEARGARVVWQSGLFAGVRFTKPLSLPKQTSTKRSFWGSLRRA